MNNRIYVRQFDRMIFERDIAPFHFEYYITSLQVQIFLHFKWEL